ncbi:MAG: YdcF family protein [Alphaproteobacteria bacterium]|nr:YdcF family protein [Alphaproteobacteria bacterium]
MSGILRRTLFTRAAAAVVASAVPEGLLSIANYDEAALQVYNQIKQRVPLASEGEDADAVVVFSGDIRRLAAALQITKAHHKLFFTALSDPLYGWRDLVNYLCHNKLIDFKKIEVEPRNVVIDYKARNTVQNAQETRNWLAEQRDPKIGKIIVVSSETHVPRCHLELARVIPPDVCMKFYPYYAPDTPACEYFVEGRKLMRQLSLYENLKIPDLNWVPDFRSG